MSASDSSSSPEPSSQQQQKEPKFTIESIEPSSREGEHDKFVIISVKNVPKDQEQQQLQRFRVTRTFHDFQFLEQQLFNSGQCLYGYILPPFPTRLSNQQSSSANNAPLATISQYDQSANGSNNNNNNNNINQRPTVLPGYGRFVSDEFQLFHWLRLVLEHHVFGHSGLIEPFLCEKSIPPPGKIIKPLGIIKSIQDTIDSRKYAHKDCDLFFQNERDWSIKVSELMHLSMSAFNETINARHSLSQVLAHLSAALSLPIGDNSNNLNKIALQTNLAFSRALDGYREYVEAETINGAATLGATLLLWTRFVESEKEMLKQRTCLLVDYESANRNFDRARGHKRPEVERTKWQAERDFEKCSDIARGEIKRFQATRVKDLAKSLDEYRNSQLNLAKNHYNKLSELCQQVITITI